MKITIVDGSPLNYNKPNYSQNLAKQLNGDGHQVFIFKANEKKINYCTGCWSCWWKTPGICPQKDDMPEFYSNYMNSDLVLHFSPMKMGFISSLLKTINDRTIPLIHPFMTVVNGECHHKKRYEKYPKLGLIVDPLDSDEEDLEITKELYQRMALNLKTELSVFTTTKNTNHAISNI